MPCSFAATCLTHRVTVIYMVGDMCRCLFPSGDETWIEARFVVLDVDLFTVMQDGSAP